VLEALSPKLRRSTERVLDKARSKGHVRALGKLTAEVDGEHRFVEDVPLIVRETHSDAGLPAAEALDRMLHAYLASLSIDRRALLSRYRIVDVARKWWRGSSHELLVILLQGVDSDDPLFLQVKQANPPCWRLRLDQDHFPDEGRRVVAGQRLIQGSPTSSSAGRGRGTAFLCPPACRHEGQREVRRA